MRKTLGLLLCFALLGVVGVVHAHDATSGRITGIYSDMGYHSDTGDVTGDEVFIVFSNRGYYVVFQASEGEPRVPVVIPAKVVGNAISFVLPTGSDPRGAFHGKVEGDALIGTFHGNGQTVHLKRGQSYWQ